MASIRHTSKEKILVVDDLLEPDRSGFGAIGILFPYTLDILVCWNHLVGSASRIALDGSGSSCVTSRDKSCIAVGLSTVAVRVGQGFHAF